MGIKTIEYVVTFDLDGEHTFAIKRLGGFFIDTLEVTIDHQQVLVTQAHSLRTGPHRHHCSVAQYPVEIIWKWNWRNGDPLYIALKQGDTLLAVYGDAKALTNADVLVAGSNRAEPRKITALSIIQDELERIDSAQIAQENFPLDNSSGSDVLSVEYEISKSLNSSLNITNREQVESHLKGTLLTVLESQLAGHLSRVTAHTIGEIATRRQQVKFSVKPGEAVVYTVTWKITNRAGVCHFSIDGNTLRVPYSVGYGLTFEISSKPLLHVPASASSHAHTFAGALPDPPNSSVQHTSESERSTVTRVNNS